MAKGTWILIHGILISEVRSFSGPSQLPILNSRVVSLDKFHFPQHDPMHRSKKQGLHMSSMAEPMFEKFGKGVTKDYKARLPLLKSDVLDGLNTQVGHSQYTIFLINVNQCSHFELYIDSVVFSGNLISFLRLLSTCCWIWSYFWYSDKWCNWDD